MGRRREAAEIQAAKGFPGRRRSKTEKQIAEAEELARLLVAAPGEGGDRLAPPILLKDPRCAGALHVWQELAPKLDRRNLFGDLDRYTFAIFCVYASEFVAAQKDILDNGYARNVRTVSGDLMPRVNPNVDRRDTAQKIMLELSRRFGLTPLDYYVLAHQQSQAPAAGLFAQRGVDPPPAPSPASPPPPKEEAPDAGPIGILGALDSAPPGRPN